MIDLVCSRSPRPIGGALMAYLHSVNRPMVVLWLEWFSVGLLLSAMALLGVFGPLWACAAVGFAFTVRALAAMIVVRRAGAIAGRTFLGGLVGPLLACLPMLAVVLLADQRARADDWGYPFSVLTGECLVGALVYVGSVLLIARPAALELVRLSRSASSDSAGATPLAGAERA